MFPLLEEGGTGQGQVCILIFLSSLVISANCKNTSLLKCSVRVILIMLCLSYFYVDHYELWETTH